MNHKVTGSTHNTLSHVVYLQAVWYISAYILVEVDSINVILIYLRCSCCNDARHVFHDQWVCMRSWMWVGRPWISRLNTTFQFNLQHFEPLRKWKSLLLFVVVKTVCIGVVHWCSVHLSAHPTRPLGSCNVCYGLMAACLLSCCVCTKQITLRFLSQ